MSPPLLLALLLLCCGAFTTGAQKFSYESKNFWKNQFEMCNGVRQSPINLTQETSTYSNIRPWVFRQEETEQYNLKVQNDGITLKVTFPQNLKIRMGTDQSKMMYTAAQMHWHWGLDRDRGSEHRLDGQAFPMEGHMVFWNCDEYTSLTDALAGPPGSVAVIAVFYAIGSNNTLISTIENEFKNIRFPSSRDVVASSGFNVVEAFLPPNSTSFYQYNGSLTTPTCNENVLWTVYTQPVSISQRQLQLMSSAFENEDRFLLGDNFRDPQPLGNRTVYRSFGKAGEDKVPNGASGLSAALPVQLLAAAAGVCAHLLLLLL